MLTYFSRAYDRKFTERAVRFGRRSVPFAFNGGLAFARNNVPDTVEAFRKWTEWELNDDTYFRPLMEIQKPAQWGDQITFRSGLANRIEMNQYFTVRSKLSYNKRFTRHAVIVISESFAKDYYQTLPRLFSKFGMSVFQVPLPFHFGRGGDVQGAEKYVLSADLGQTLHSTRQAVMDVLQTVRWLRSKGYLRISVVGFCYGGLIAGLAAAHSEEISRCAMVVSGGSMADVVWSGDSFVGAKAQLSQHLTLDEVRACWKLANLETHAEKLARPDFELMLLSGKVDNIVKKPVVDRLRSSLVNADVDFKDVTLPTGHASMGVFPNNVLAAKQLLSFLYRRPIDEAYSLFPAGL